MAENTSIGQPTPVTEGPFAGWMTWGLGSDPFETLTGPYHMKRLDDGAGWLCGFLPGPQNCNGHGNIHGGALMTFADFCLFAHAHDDLAGPCVTVQFESQFTGGAKPGAIIESRGEVTRSTRSLVFVRGLMSQEGRPVLAYSGLLKRIGA